MTPNEFKAWFEGFTEAFSGVPSKVQWTRIKARVAEIDGKPISERVFIDRYWPHYYPSYPGWTYLTAVGRNSVIAGFGSTVSCAGSSNADLQPQSLLQYSAENAMYVLGKADAQAVVS